MMSRIVTTGGTERCTLFLPLTRPMRPAGLSISSWVCYILPLWRNVLLLHLAVVNFAFCRGLEDCLDLSSSSMWTSSGQYPTGTPPTEESGPLAENTPLTSVSFRLMDRAARSPFHQKKEHVGVRARANASRCVRRLEVAVRRSAGALAATRQQSYGCAYSDVRWESTSTTFNIITIITTCTSHGGCRNVYASGCLCVFLAPYFWWCAGRNLRPRGGTHRSDSAALLDLALASLRFDAGLLRNISTVLYHVLIMMTRRRAVSAQGGRAGLA